MLKARVLVWIGFLFLLAACNMPDVRLTDRPSEVEEDRAGVEEQPGTTAATESISATLTTNLPVISAGSGPTSTHTTNLPLVPVNGETAEAQGGVVTATMEINLPVLPVGETPTPGDLLPAPESGEPAQPTGFPDRNLPEGSKGLPETAQGTGYGYGVQSGTPLGMPNVVDPEAGCNWMGVGGQVFDLDGNEVSGMIVQVTGTVEDQPLLLLALSGSNQTLGPGGFALRLSDHPVDSQGSVSIQLFDLSGDPQSGRVFFNTYADCERNLVLINFTGREAPEIWRYFPFAPVAK